MKDRKNITIVPDVHGRTFWRTVKNDKDADRIIFLGDYLDPYWDEGILPQDALEEFREILSFARDNADRVTLLLGNHDLGYLDERICSCRHDYGNACEIRNLFLDNLDLFNITAVESRDGIDVLFSHAGIHMEWVTSHPRIFPDGQFVPDVMNGMLHDDKRRRELLTALADVSWYRGGGCATGSPVWADIEEYGPYGDDGLPESYAQIVGHTQQPKGMPSIRKGIMCLDCKTVFRI